MVQDLGSSAAGVRALSSARTSAVWRVVLVCFL